MVDVDAVQINFTAHFRWMDRGYHDLLAELGHPLAVILAGGNGTPVVSCSCSYVRPVQLDDEVTIESRIRTVGRSSFSVEHSITHDGAAVATGTMGHVWVKAGEPPRALPVPDWLREAA